MAKLLARMFGCVTVWKNIIMQPFCKLNLIVVELIGLDVFGVLDYNYVLITILLLFVLVAGLLPRKCVLLTHCGMLCSKR